ANPAPAFICRLADQILVKVNQGFLDMLGYARDDVFGRSLAEVGLLNGVEKAETIQERLAEGRTIPQTEVQLPLRSGGSKL
ncbi:PAS domain-containing protein, partial [Acinetobacter baumannii]